MTLAEKILNVMSAVAVIGKDTRNDEVGYNYVSAAKLNAAVSAALRENRVICLPKIIDTDLYEQAEETLATVKLETKLQDVDSDEFFVITTTGSGIDKGDKAIAKAQTMALKYAWKMALVIAEKGDDPDTNTNTDVYAKTKTSSNVNSVWLRK